MKPYFEIKSPYKQAYSYLNRLFSPIEKSLDLERQFDLDSILDTIATKWQKEIENQSYMFKRTIQITRNLCAEAICSLCRAQIPLYEINGRFVHREDSPNSSGLLVPTINVRCAASPIWLLGTPVHPVHVRELETKFPLVKHSTNGQQS